MTYANKQIEFRFKVDTPTDSLLSAALGARLGQNLVARYSPDSGKLSIWFPHGVVSSVVPGSRTYRNIIELIVSQLRTSNLEQRVAGYVSAFRDFAIYVEHVVSWCKSAAVTSSALEIFLEDFRPARGRIRPRRRLFSMRMPKKRSLSVREHSLLHLPVLSSIEIEEISLLDEPESPEPLGDVAARAFTELKTELRFLSQPTISISEGEVEASVEFLLPRRLLKRVEFFFHYGPHGAPGWCDQEMAAWEITSVGVGKYQARSKLHISNPGEYACTVCARPRDGRDRVWQGRFLLDDTRFTVVPADVELNRNGSEHSQNGLALSADDLNKAISSLTSFTSLLSTLKRKKVRSIGKTLFDFAKEDAAARKQLSSLLDLAKSDTNNESRAGKLKAVRDVIENIGIGEIVMVSPEGPHAMAGGLAHVISGLLKSFEQFQIPATLIAPLYEESQGHKHQSAKNILEHGFPLGSRRIPIEEVGTVDIRFGPTTRWGSTEIVRSPLIIKAKVYLAETDGLRIFLLRHPRYADKLYANVWSDEQILRGLFLSRGAIEIIRKDNWHVSPHVLLTNDWLTAFVPALLATDSEYVADEVLAKIQTAHVIHNGGRDYQGRFPTQHFGEDLFPLIGVAPDHFFGMQDPTDPSSLNITAAALNHVRKAILTVSRPYAAQLLTVEGAEGLEELYLARKDLLFGISNGIDLDALRRVFWSLGEGKGEKSPVDDRSYRPDKLLENLPKYKRKLKSSVQRKYRLKESSDALLISLVGRITEQKGIQLLAGEGDVLRSVLENYPSVQYLIAGPAAVGDRVAERFKVEVEQLERDFPGRIKGEFNFLVHSEALEITEASDLFLMPSRYEPGGITQLEALAAGTLVIARNVGGISVTLSDYSEQKKSGTGFLFGEFTAQALYEKTTEAVRVMGRSEIREELCAAAAEAQNDWLHRVPKYRALFQLMGDVLKPEHAFPHLAERLRTVEEIRP